MMNETITVYLGSRCNLDCAYCHREASPGEGHVSDALIARIGNMRGRVKFYGGEPLLYMDEIRRVVESSPDHLWAVATNGKGIEEHLPFFRKHRFLVCLSWDGTDGAGLRGFDPLTKPIGYPDVAVSCTLCHGNCDFSAILRNFAQKERVTGRHLSFYPHIMHVTSPGNAPLALTADDFGRIAEQYAECVASFVFGLRRGVVNRVYFGLWTQLENARTSGFEWGETRCVNRHLRKVDAAGRDFSCLYVRDDPLPAGYLKRMGEILDERFPACRACPVYSMCGAACVKSAEHGLECAFYRRLFTWYRGFYAENAAILERAKRWIS